MTWKLSILSGTCLLLNYCAASQNTRTVNLIIYDDFKVPKATYDLIVEDFHNSGFVDSIKIKGRPIYINSVNFKIDTSVVNRFEIPLSDLNNFLDSIKTQFPPDKIQHQLIELSGGQKIPVSSVSDIYIERVPYKPRIYFTKPDCYKFKGECVVKVELFCKKRSKKDIIKHIHNIMSKHTGSFVIEKWRYEIIFDRLP